MKRVDLPVTMHPGPAQLQIQPLTSFEQIERQREFWTGACRDRDADIDFYRLIVEARPGASPYVLRVSREGLTKALVVSRLEPSSVSAKTGYIRVPAPQLRTLEVLPGGSLGEIGEDEADAVAGFLQHALRRHAFDVVRLSYAENDAPLTRHLRRSAGPLTRDRVQVAMPHWRRDLTRISGSFEASLSKHARAQHRQRERALVNAFDGDVQIARLDSLADVARLIEAGERVTRSSYQRSLNVGFQDTNAMRTRLAFLAGRGWLRGRVLELKGRPVAHWIGSAYRGTFLSEFLSFDPKFTEFAPGIYLTMKVLAELQDEDNEINMIDLGPGGGLYKQRLGNVVTQVATSHIFAPTAHAVWANLTRMGVHALTSSARQLVRRAGALDRVKRAMRRRAQRARDADIPERF